PICVGLSSVVMPSSGSVTIWAKDFDSGSSVDDCTAHEDLLFSFSGTTYQPSRVFDCAAIEANGSPSFLVEIWVADEGNDQNCNGFVSPLGIEWGERNKDFCTTFIVIDDNEGVCGDSLTGGVIETEEYEAVEQVTVKMTDQNGQVINTFVTDGNGLYHFINPLFDYTIESRRNDNHKNGVSTLDLVAIQKHLLGLQPLNSPYKMIAADANNSESVSALDLVEIRKLILGLYIEFPKNTSWRFVDADYEFPDPTHPWPFDEVIESHSGMTMHEDFVGVKVGDVNGTVTANATQITTRGARNVLKLQIQDYELKQGETIKVPVKAENYRDMLGYQFTIDLDGLKYVGIEAGTIAIQPEYVGVHTSALTMSWGDHKPMTVSNEEVLFTLQFTATASGSLSEMLEITSKITEAEAYTTIDEKIELLDVVMVFGTSAVSTPLEFALYQNEPNPFADQTVIGFDLPAAMPATLTLYDMSGKMIHLIEGDYAKGYNEVVLKRRDLVADGAYYYYLQAGDFTASKKMILSR
ncbi:MAG TPA: T9SS type A sorting domain-containing protein, partial [Saprospiraceae bacterium]|nr:T9SS type A sorting domain-containing protein [Saprospiraceae bacterium]